MKPDGETGWSLIQRDPCLRMELLGIEQHNSSADELVSELLGFFSRIEGVTRLVLALSEEEMCMNETIC